MGKTQRQPVYIVGHFVPHVMETHAAALSLDGCLFSDQRTTLSLYGLRVLALTNIGTVLHDCYMLMLVYSDK